MEERTLNAIPVCCGPARAGRKPLMDAIVSPSYRGSWVGGGRRRARGKMNIGTWLFTLWKGKLVGTDPFGNRYYRERSPRALKLGGGFDSRERRWVIYKGEAEASKVPPEWHAWLHHTIDEIPSDTG